MWVECIWGVVSLPDKCPVCGHVYDAPLSGVVGDGQPLDVREYTRVCFSKDYGHGTFYSFIHTADLPWKGDLLEFADQS